MASARTRPASRLASGVAARLVEQLEMLVAQLRASPTPRTIWLDPYGRLWHGAPAEPPPHDRWRALGTFVRPTTHDLALALPR